MEVEQEQEEEVVVEEEEEEEELGGGAARAWVCPAPRVGGAGRRRGDVYWGGSYVCLRPASHTPGSAIGMKGSREGSLFDVLLRDCFDIYVGWFGGAPYVCLFVEIETVE